MGNWSYIKWKSGKHENQYTGIKIEMLEMAFKCMEADLFLLLNIFKAKHLEKLRSKMPNSACSDGSAIWYALKPSLIYFD